jgi:hypothetical protein
MSREAGKGDSYRKVDQDAYGTNYDNIFRKPKILIPIIKNVEPKILTEQLGQYVAIPPVEGPTGEEGQREE